MSLANIQGKLSRSELKNIMAGSGMEDGGIYCSAPCGWCLNTMNIGPCVSSKWGTPWGKNVYCYTGGHGVRTCAIAIA